jgi:hypothetical protein
MNADLILAKIVEVLTPYQTPALALVALIAINVLTGVGAAVRAKVFDLQKLAEFYRVSVIPNLIGWLAISALTSIATQAFLEKALAETISGAQAWSMYSAAALSLLASIRENIAEIQKPSLARVELTVVAKTVVEPEKRVD